MTVVLKSRDKADLFAPFTEEYFAQFAQSLNGNDAIRNWRRTNFEQALAAAAPSNRDEDFKYVNFRGLKLIDLKPELLQWLRHSHMNTLMVAGIDKVEQVPEEYTVDQVQADPAQNIFFGSFADAHSGEPARFTELLEFFNSKFLRRKFALLAHAFLSQGAYLHVKKNTAESSPRQVFTSFSGENVMRSFATVAQIDENSRGSLVWDINSLGNASGLLNGTLDVIVKSGSHLNLLLTQHLTGLINSVSTVRVYLEKDAMLEMATICSGGQINLMEIDIKFAGSGAQALVNGVYLGREKENFNLLTHQDHQIGHTNSDLFYIGTLSGESSSNYLGKITIAANAQRSDAYQKNRNLILNKGCSVNSSPKLEIGANDVRCTHGATTAKVSDLETFYLRSRGIDYPTAKVLLADGFISQVTPRIKSPLLRSGFARRLEALLHQWGGKSVE
jgi:Fe-S cluster assembly protein SufD